MIQRVTNDTNVQIWKSVKVSLIKLGADIHIKCFSKAERKIEIEKMIIAQDVHQRMYQPLYSAIKMLQHIISK